MLPAAPAQASHQSLKEIKEEMAKTRAQIAALEREDSAVESILNQVSARLAQERAELNEQRALLNKITLMIRGEERQLERLIRRADRRQAVINTRARSLYISGPTETFVGGSTPTAVLDSMTRAGMLEYVASFDRRVLEDIAELRAEAKLTREALRKEREKQREIEEDIAERVAGVAEIVATQQAAHNKLSSRIQAYRNELAALAREQERIRNLILSRSGGVTTGGSSSYGYAWPIRGNITSPYGPRWGGFHTGIDIDCNTGNPIGASKAGRVIASEYSGGYGYMVIIDHGGGFSSLYAHMSRLDVRRGQSVSQGSRVGLCGSTGNSTGDHLHFEIRVNGNHRNPRPYLP